jgi:hypothetical protein
MNEKIKEVETVAIDSPQSAEKRQTIDFNYDEAGEKERRSIKVFIDPEQDQNCPDDDD